MGLFDRMFGHGAEEAEKQPDAQQRFNELKGKYQTVLNEIQQQNVQLQNLHVQDNKLFIRGTAPSEDAKNGVWDQIKLVDQNWENDLICDISVDESKAQAAAASAGGGDGGSSGQTYTVKPGDTLSKIAREFYGSPSQYMKIFYANQDQLDDPDHIRAGQELTIPSE